MCTRTTDTQIHEANNWRSTGQATKGTWHYLIVHHYSDAQKGRLQIKRGNIFVSHILQPTCALAGLPFLEKKR